MLVLWIMQGVRSGLSHEIETGIAVIMKKLLLAATIGSAAMLSGCYDTGDQAVLDKLLNEKTTAEETAREAKEELSQLKEEIEALKKANAEKEKAAEEAKEQISKAETERKELEAKLKEEEAARAKAEDQRKAKRRPQWSRN